MMYPTKPPLPLDKATNEGELDTRPFSSSASSPDYNYLTISIALILQASSGGVFDAPLVFSDLRAGAPELFTPHAEIDA
jgi:hypothetical protein